MMSTSMMSTSMMIGLRVATVAVCVWAALPIAAPAAGRTGQDPAAETAAETPEPILGAPAAFDLSGERTERLPVAAGTELYQAAARRSPVIARLDVAAELEVVQRRGPWIRVRYRDLLGWLLSDDGEDATDAADATDTADAADAAGGARVESEQPALPASLKASAGVDPDRLEALLAALGPERTSRTAGGYRLETDLADADVVARLARLVAGLDRAFARRYRIEPPPPGGEVVAIFARETDYRAFARTDPDLPATDVVGHARDGIAALAAERRSSGQLEVLLIHELGHLVVRRTLGLELPPWLDEGLAEDLAYSRVDDDGTLIPGSLNDPPPVRIAARTFAAHDGMVAYAERRLGGRTALRELRRDLPRMPPLATLPDLDSETFYGDRRHLHYAQSAFFVRYLLDGETDDLARRFHGFLRAVANGDRADAATLRGRLERDWPDLEQGFSRWLRRGAPGRLSE